MKVAHSHSKDEANRCRLLFYFQPILSDFLLFRAINVIVIVAITSNN